MNTKSGCILASVTLALSALLGSGCHAHGHYAHPGYYPPPHHHHHHGPPPRYYAPAPHHHRGAPPARHHQHGGWRGRH